MTTELVMEEQESVSVIPRTPLCDGGCKRIAKVLAVLESGPLELCATHYEGGRDKLHASALEIREIESGTELTGRAS